MEDIARQILDDNGFEDWEVDDSTVTDPDGNVLEWDHPRSPLRLLGLI